MTRDIRVHLRHTGSSTLRFGVVRLTWDWGWNILLGRYVLVFRDRNEDPEHYKPRGFFDLAFGRSMFKQQRMLDRMTLEERQTYWDAYNDRRDTAITAFLNGEYVLKDK